LYTNVKNDVSYTLSAGSAIDVRRLAIPLIPPKQTGISLFIKRSASHRVTTAICLV